jgi:hypothetical protein
MSMALPARMDAVATSHGSGAATGRAGWLACGRGIGENSQGLAVCGTSGYHLIPGLGR